MNRRLLLDRRLFAATIKRAPRFIQPRKVRGNGRECLICRRREPRFSRRGTVKADSQHTLCLQCYRDERNRNRLSFYATRF
jgi:hypothetical protein